MKKYHSTKLAILLLFLLTAFSSCQAIADIFKAGMWTGIIIVVAVIALIIYLIGKSRKG